MIVINRVDGDNVDVPKLVATIRDHWGSSCVPINVPNGTGAKFTAVHSALQIKGDVPAGLPHQVDVGADEAQRDHAGRGHPGVHPRGV